MRVVGLDHAGRPRGRATTSWSTSSVASRRSRRRSSPSTAAGRPRQPDMTSRSRPAPGAGRPDDHAAVAALADLRVRQHLRQDDPRLAPRGHRDRARAGPACSSASATRSSRSSTRRRRARSSSAVVAAVPPILAGLAGKAVNVGTLGGYLQYKYGTFFPIIVSLWSILALSGTLAAEARRGSLEFVAASADDPPPDRAREAVRPPDRPGDRRHRRVPGPSSSPVARSTGLPGDAITVQMAAGYALWLFLLGHRRRVRRVRARAVRRPRLGGRHRRRGHVRRVHRQRLPGGDPDARARSRT